MRIVKHCLSAALAALLLSASAQAVLVAHYRFDEGSGDTAFDSATADGAQNAVTNQGTVGWSTGIIGGALDLPGNASMQAMDAIGEGATAFTISVWVNVRDTPPYDGIYMSRRPPGTGANQENWGIAVEGGNAAALHYDYRYDNAPVGTGGSNGVDSPNGSAVVGMWQHLVMTWSTESDPESPNYARYIYLDGAQVGTPPQPNDIDNTYNGFLATWNIGDDPCCGGRELNGMIDDLAVWRDVALSPSEILSIYNQGLSGVAVGDPPVTLGDVNGDTLVDGTDFEVIRQNFWQPFAERSEGDLVNNNFIDLADYAQWRQAAAMGNSAALASTQVPEPSVLVAMAAATIVSLGILRFRGRRLPSKQSGSIA